MVFACDLLTAEYDEQLSDAIIIGGGGGGGTTVRCDIFRWLSTALKTYFNVFLQQYVILAFLNSAFKFMTLNRLIEYLYNSECFMIYLHNQSYSYTTIDAYLK